MRGVTPASRVTRVAVPALVAALATGSLAGSSQAAPGDSDGPSRSHDDRRTVTYRKTHHSSDGVPGELATGAPSARLNARVREDWSFKVGPGVRFRRFYRTDSRGQIRACLVTVKLDNKHPHIAYLEGRRVRNRQPVGEMVREASAAVGINGNFFDIDDTGAPRGVGRDPKRALRHATRVQWTQGLWTFRKLDLPAVGGIQLTASVPNHPALAFGGFNRPYVPEERIGIYNRSWGSRMPGYAVLDGYRPTTRQLVVKDGRVVDSDHDLDHTDTAFRGDMVLVGRGSMADKLANFAVGDRIRIRRGLDRAARVAVGGSGVILRDGQVKTSDDGEMHPRTAVGIDRDGRRLLMLVIDGRQDFSRGYTLVELARMLKWLGAEDAINFDGGGSSTMVVRRPNGRLAVVNSPSDGHQRHVPDGLGIRIRR